MDLSRVGDHDPIDRTDAAREAAVLVPVVRRRDGDFLLFTLRAEHLGEHPGQMSFPGGGREPEDADLRATALREASEEVGMDPDGVSIVGRLDDIVTVTDYAVRPFVGTVPHRDYVAADAEVAEVVVLPVAALLDPANYESDRREHPEHGELLIDYFCVDGYTVWGATGRILAQFLSLATDWRRPDGPAPDA